MASIAVFRQGQTNIVTVPASSAIAIWTQGKANVYQVGVAATQTPLPGVLLTTVKDGVPYLSSAFTSGAKLIIECQQEAPVYYEVGVTPFVHQRMPLFYQGDPGVLNATGTLTAALIYTGLVTSTTAAAVTATLDTGTIMDASSVWAIGDSFDWSAIATGANAFTVTAAASGHTVVGAGAVATGTSGRFRTRKTAANTFVTYRIS